jgi:hypothetical protein
MQLSVALLTSLSALLLKLLSLLLVLQLLLYNSVRGGGGNGGRIGNEDNFVVITHALPFTAAISRL